jgi:hypothetical protein
MLKDQIVKYHFPARLIHPKNDFGLLGRGSMGSKSCIRLVWLMLMLVVNINQLAKHHFWARIQVPNHHGTLNSASQPSCMILDGSEGGPRALSLASGRFGCCWLSINQLVKYHHCWARIQISPLSMAPKPLLLNHPNSIDISSKWFWMVGKGIHML